MGGQLDKRMLHWQPATCCNLSCSLLSVIWRIKYYYYYYYYYTGSSRQPSHVAARARGIDDRRSSTSPARHARARRLRRSVAAAAGAEGRRRHQRRTWSSDGGNLHRQRCIGTTSNSLLTRRLGRSLFLLRNRFWPSFYTAKSQPIWIKFCTHLLLYGIHLWADLDRDRHAGASRPNQNNCVFCNTCKTTDRRDFGGNPSKWRRGRELS